MSILDDLRSMHDEDTFDWEGRCVCDVPERKPGYGAYVCNRPTCAEALSVAVLHDRNLKVCIKWGHARRQVWDAFTYVALVSSSATEDDFARACGVWFEPHDVSYESDIPGGEPEVFHQHQYVREIFIVHDPERDGE